CGPGGCAAAHASGGGAGPGAAARGGEAPRRGEAGAASEGGGSETPAGQGGDARGSGEAGAESEGGEGDAQGDDGEAPPGRAPLPGASQQRRHHQVRRRVSVAGRGTRSTPSSEGST